MKSGSILKKLAMFAIVLSLVMSVAGTAFAHGGDDHNPPPPQITEHYILHYCIMSHAPGQPENPIDETAGSRITPSAVVSLEGYYFSGWTRPHWELIAEGEECHRYGRDITKVYEATVCGFFSLMEIKHQTQYSLLYKGFIPGVIFWPNDVVGSATQPGLGGDPILNGYDFLGWTPALLDWSKAVVTDSQEIIDPEGLCPPYIMITHMNTLTVEAVFKGITPPPEIPVAAPQTGSGNVMVYAIALTILAVATVGCTIIRSRRNDT